jgi:hypothetical protein
MLTKRLQVQLAEMDHAAEANQANADDKLTTAKPTEVDNGDVGRRSMDSLSTMTGVGGAATEEDDKERAIAKAALSIAELGQTSMLWHRRVNSSLTYINYRQYLY